MTATVKRPHARLVESTDAELRTAVSRALSRAGRSYDELAQQATHGDFESMAARTAWVAVRDLREYAD